MTNWTDREPRPLWAEVLNRRKMPPPVADEVAYAQPSPEPLYHFLVAMGCCPGCGVELSLDEPDYTDSDYCVDCAGERAERSE